MSRDPTLRMKYLCTTCVSCKECVAQKSALQSKFLCVTVHLMSSMLWPLPNRCCCRAKPSGYPHQIVADALNHTRCLFYNDLPEVQEVWAVCTILEQVHPTTKRAADTRPEPNWSVLESATMGG